MKEFKIDERYLTHIASQVKKAIEGLTRYENQLSDLNEDIFVRYMAMARLTAYIQAANMVVTLQSQFMQLGHDLSHPIFKTPELEKEGWDEIDLGSNEFFCNAKVATDEQMEKFRDAFIEQLKAMSTANEPITGKDFVDGISRKDH